MPESPEIGPRSDIARVLAVTDEGRCLYLEFRNGQSGTARSDSPFDIPPGSVVLVQPDRIDVAPKEVWPEESWVGVIRLKLPDLMVVDTGGRLRITPPPEDIECGVGYTVEARDTLGVVRVLSENPIRFLDLPDIDDSVIDAFHSKGASTAESFEDFGGLAQVVERARELVEVPLENHERLAEIGARPIKGVLFTGPPGTGKTMLARIIANKASADFYEISGPEVFSKWFGQSEEILRKIFEAASKKERAIVFFDEIDSVASQRSEDAHEASRRVVAQLLTLMDGFSPDDNVVVIATTNRPQDIDVALRRPGRFDWEVHFPLPDESDREAILNASAMHLTTLEPLPHKYVAGSSDGWSGAELSAIWSEAALLAVADGRSVIVAEDYLGGFQRVADQRRRFAPLFSKGRHGDS